MTERTGRTGGEPDADALAGFMRKVAQDRDREAFAALFDYYAPRLKGFLMKRGANAETAEEIVQETLISVWAKAPSFDAGKGSPSTWVFTIARNLRIDRTRREMSRQPPPDYEDIEPLYEPPAGDDAMISKEEGELVQEAIAELPADQLEVIRLAYVEDRSQSEIASHLGVPLGTVKSRMRLAYQRLREKLDSLK